MTQMSSFIYSMDKRMDSSSDWIHRKVKKKKTIQEANEIHLSVNGKRKKDSSGAFKYELGNVPDCWLKTL